MLRECTLKCIFLIAITTSKRCSEIQALGREPRYLTEEKMGYRIQTVQGVLHKTAIPGHLRSDIYVPLFWKVNNDNHNILFDHRHTN